MTPAEVGPFVAKGKSEQLKNHTYTYLFMLIWAGDSNGKFWIQIENREEFRGKMWGKREVKREKRKKRREKGRKEGNSNKKEGKYPYFD